MTVNEAIRQLTTLTQAGYGAYELLGSSDVLNPVTEFKPGEYDGNDFCESETPNAIFVKVKQSWE
jgi:hypothetical protein